MKTMWHIAIERTVNYDQLLNKVEIGKEWGFNIIPVKIAESANIVVTDYKIILLHAYMCISDINKNIHRHRFVFQHE